MCVDLCKSSVYYFLHTLPPHSAEAKRLYEEKGVWTGISACLTREEAHQRARQSFLMHEYVRAEASAYAVALLSGALDVDGNAVSDTETAASHGDTDNDADT